MMKGVLVTAVILTTSAFLNRRQEDRKKVAAATARTLAQLKEDGFRR